MRVARRAAIALNAEHSLWQGSAHRPGPAPKAVEVEPATVLGWASGCPSAQWERWSHRCEGLGL